MSYGRETTADEILEGVDLTGKVAVITGASSGLGQEVARALAAHGADVFAAVRDPVTYAGPGSVVELDLTSLESIRIAAAKMSADLPHIDLLFNNAGVMATPEVRTADDFELQIGTNHLGHFLLTALLIDPLAAGRIINTTSLGHRITGMLWDDPHFRNHPYDKWVAYGQSKSANILFTRGLAARGHTAYAVHPGAIHTGLSRHLEAAELTMVEQSSTSEIKTVEQGAATLVWAAVGDGAPSGAYLADCAVADAAEHATDETAVDRLWSWSEDQVGQRFK